MTFFDDIKKKVQADNSFIFVIVSFLVWIFIFRGFLTDKLALVMDATPYYGHIKFYLDNVAQGVYPLWDPTWRSGVPAEFFLRRIGNFNPLYFVILFFHKLGIAYTMSYLMFLTFYYFLGMIAFYKIAKLLFKHTAAAYLALLFLMFSSLSAQLFFNYIILIFVPIMWFFYFLIAFTLSKQRHCFLGILFTLMIILTTYIPFYFVFILMSFLAIFMILYFRNLRSILAGYTNFFSKNKILVLLCALILCTSLGPGLMLYKEGAKGEVVLPIRHQQSSSKNIFSVGQKNIKGGDIFSQIYFDRLVTNLKDLELGVLYVPFFAIVMFVLGLATKVNKRIILLTIWSFIICATALTDTTPLHRFFYKHIFFFKFIRQSYYFLWIMILPAFMFLIGEQFDQILSFRPKTKKGTTTALIYIVCVHCGLIFFLISLGNNIMSTFLVLLVSFGSCIAYLFGFLGINSSGTGNLAIRQKTIFFIILLILAVTQPLEAYYYLSQNSAKKEHDYLYDRPYLSFSFQKYPPKNISLKPKSSDDIITSRPREIYYGTQGYHTLSQNMDHRILHQYMNNRFVLYDQTEMIDDDLSQISRIQKAFENNSNIAFISTEASTEHARDSSGPYATSAEIIEGNSKFFDVLKYNVNSIKIRTHFDKEKFLVYNDSFHSGWRAFIDGKQTKIYRSNVAFKGIWVPPGERIVYFQFLPVRYYVLGIFYHVLFLVVFMALVVSWVRSSTVPNDRLKLS